MFKAKLWRMGKHLSKIGGTKRLQQLEKWKTGPQSVWSLSVNSEEVQKQTYEQKQQVEKLLEQEIAKREKFESTVEVLKAELKTLKADQQKTERSLSRLRMGKSESGRGNSSKSWTNYSRQHQTIKRKQLVADIKNVVSSCSTQLEPLTMKVLNAESGEVQHLDLEKGAFTKPSSNGQENEILNSVLSVKDKFALSDKAYHELAQVTKELPRLHQLKSREKELNCKQQIVPAPENIAGVQQSLNDRLVVRIRYTLSKDSNFREYYYLYKKVRVKLSGDGTRVGRNLHVVNVTFTLIDELQAASVAGNYTLAIFEMSESYDELRTALQNITTEVEELKTVIVDGHSYNLQYFLGGDWKFLSLICGLNAANSKYSCIWCKCPSGKRWDMKLKWSLQDQKCGARTIEEIKQLSKEPPKKRYGCVRQPLFQSVPITHVVIDSLHLFLRVADVLINLLIMDLQRADGIRNSRIDKIDRTKESCIIVYERFLNEQCRISFQWYTSNSKLECRDLTGPEKTRLFATINIPALFPSIQRNDDIQRLWTDFWKLVQLLKADCDDHVFKSEAHKWLELFCSIYQTKHVTPYIHALAMHVHEFLNLYGSLSKFSQQGLEKLNDTTTLHYFRGTNHKKEDALYQILQKRNRPEELEATGCARKKRKCKCSICGKEGHNKQTCSLTTQVTTSSSYMQSELNSDAERSSETETV